MRDDYTPTKSLSGFQQRKRRVAAGLPRYGPAEQESRRRNDAARNVRRRADLRERADAIKLERGCADCGYRAHAAALDFDHLPGTTKTDRVSALTCRHGTSWDRILAEIAKCEVVCANCHRIRTAERHTGLYLRELRRVMDTAPSKDEGEEAWKSNR